MTLCTLNENNRGIHLNYEASREKINFLDLTISVSEDSFVTSTYFKSTDRNSYISTDSCHHASWLGSRPKSQYLRLKRSCTEHKVFLAQADIITQRFVEKRYSLKTLTDTLNCVKQIDRAYLLTERPPRHERTNVFKNPFITNFSKQHQNIKHIVNKHWHILKNDRILNNLLPARPQVVFRGAVRWFIM